MLSNTSCDFKQLILILFLETTFHLLIIRTLCTRWKCWSETIWSESNPKSRVRFRISMIRVHQDWVWAEPKFQSSHLLGPSHESRVRVHLVWAMSSNPSPRKMTDFESESKSEFELNLTLSWLTELLKKLVCSYSCYLFGWFVSRPSLHTMNITTKHNSTGYYHNYILYRPRPEPGLRSFTVHRLH